MLSTTKHRLWKTVRLGLFLLIVIVGGLLFCAHQALATVKNELFEFGEELSTLLGPVQSAGVQELRINEQPIRFEVLTTRQPVAAVLDQAHTWCSRHDGRLSEQATMRQERGGRGFIACLNTGGARLTVGELVSRLKKYEETRDVHSIGDFQYVRVEPAGQATRIIRVWTEESFHVEKMFPRTGDAPGADVPGVPRPRSGRRMLSASVNDQGYRWTVYSDVSDSAGDVLHDYREGLKRQGWTILAPSADQVVVAQRTNEYVVVTVAPGSDEHLIVSIASVERKESL